MGRHPATSQPIVRLTLNVFGELGNRSPYDLAVCFEYLHWLPHVPVYLLLSLITLAGLIYVYRRVLSFEARLLQQRELHILSTVTSNLE